jgi:hypothetical protein
MKTPATVWSALEDRFSQDLVYSRKKHIWLVLTNDIYDTLRVEVR